MRSCQLIRESFPPVCPEHCRTQQSHSRRPSHLQSLHFQIQCCLLSLQSTKASASLEAN
ncbi:hypothetical protein JOB18_026599 [Solea senegalensis]|uniref:Uncharacterized protein n=1 Tax=Solea senegalensis TaxID=28829 RepID=A0AAV6SZU9_SOLSE|nr:hypothetical protein JOB18_026599 [Solea senegalensis]